MTNEFQSLSDGMVMEMYVKALHAYRSSPRIMPANDRNYLLQRKVQLRQELIRRRLILP